MKQREQVIRNLAFQMFEMSKRTWLATQREKFKGGYDLSESEFLALDALERVPSLSVGQLRQHVGVLPAQMSRVIKALEQRYDEKLVLCAINPEDKRKIDVSIAPTGRRAVDAYRRAKIQALVAALESLSDTDLADFTRILDKIAAATIRTRGRAVV
ncbi:MAG: MarR family transcriptional regulator [Planctomycetes bacterium]|nr:MarR family transcriptional regulator [Planctomycetota bacterium]